jgi:S1-C subfamily serine protease
MTNAHCVHNALHISIRRRGTARLYIAKIKAILYECDLALLELETQKKGSEAILNEFWKDLPPLPIGGMPAKLDKVYVYGYPLGGYNVSITKGVVNRVQVITYFNAVQHFAIQIDAPINFGNSGGPVVNAHGEMVGVAFAGEDDSVTQNMGYIIPTTLVRFFVELVKKNTEFNGLCSLGVEVQHLANQNLRDFVKIPHKKTGILVTKVDPLGSANKLLQENDVIMSINGKPIDNDGTMLLKDIILSADRKLAKKHADELSIIQSGEVVAYSSFISLHSPGDIVVLGVLREGKEKEVSVTLKPRNILVPLLEYQLPPTYYVIGGLVFLPLSVSLILEKRDNREYVNHLVNIAENSDAAKPGEQIVVLSEIFTTEMTSDYHSDNSILHSVNGVEILNIYHLREVIEKMKKAEYLVFKFRDTSRTIVLNVKDLQKNNKQILLDNLGHITDFASGLPGISKL